MNLIQKYATRCAFLLLTLVLTSCQSGHEVLGDLASSAGGAAMGYKLSNSSLWGAALGAGGGVGASAFLKNRFQKARSEAYSMGYQDAMNQNVKRHYWLIQNQQSQAARWKPTKTEWVPITLQEQEVNGEVHAERTEYIQVGRS